MNGQFGRHEGSIFLIAEFAILEEARQKNFDPIEDGLFVTLEPCSRRSEGKQPCAVRVALSGIKTVYPTKVGRVHLAEALSYRALTDEIRRAA